MKHYYSVETSINKRSVIVRCFSEKVDRDLYVASTLGKDTKAVQCTSNHKRCCLRRGAIIVSHYSPLPCSKKSSGVAVAVGKLAL